MTPPAPSFDRYGEMPPASPVVLSVPHAGRDYPLALRAALRVPLGALTVLEDRHVDAVALAARQGETMLVQRHARAWIDLNRSELERDPAIDEGAVWSALPAPSAKLRGGLGLVPRRIAGAGELWKRRLDADDVAARIRDDHRSYHAALAQTLAAARARFGTAAGKPRIVIGDRFGRSAAPRLVAAAHAAVAGSGYSVALNTPYAGGYVLDTHGQPARHVHALQLEIDRTLYLDPAGDQPGDGLPAITHLLRRIIDALADEASNGLAIAAE